MREAPAPSTRSYRPLRMMAAALLASALVLPLGRCAGEGSPFDERTTAASPPATEAVAPAARGMEEARWENVMYLDASGDPVQTGAAHLALLWPIPLLAFEMLRRGKRRPLVSAPVQAGMCLATAGWLTLLLNVWELTPMAGYFAGMTGAGLYLLALLLAAPWRCGTPVPAAAARSR